MFSNISIIDPKIIFDSIVSLRHRSEKEPLSYYYSYVPVLSLESFLNANTQVLYGRNGTGKTHIFHCVSEFCNAEYLNRRVVPIYIDMRTIGLTRISQEFSHEELILIFYKKVINEILTQLTTFIDTHSKYSLKTIFDKRFLPNSSEIKKSLKKIRKSMSFNNIDESVGSYVKKIREQYEKETNVKVSPKVIIPSTIGKIDIEGKSSGRNLRGEDIELVIKGMHSVDIEGVIKELENILDIMQAKSMMVLIDEWSQISLPLQPLLAEMFRKSLCTSNKVSLKFAGLKYITKFSTNVDNIRQRIGLQGGIDISELADLNRIFTYDIDHDAVKTYLTLIMIHHLTEEIYSRLKELHPKLSLIKVINASIYRHITSNVFDGEKTYDYIVKASEGNPRDFLAILAECCNATGPENLPIKAETAIASAINYFSTIKTDNIDDKKVIDVFNKIFLHCVKNESKLFLFSQDYCCDVHEICTLWHYRFIHLIEKDIPIIQDDDDIKHYCIYSIDFGKILSLVKTKEGEKKASKIFGSIKYIVDKFVYNNPHKNIIQRLQNYYKENNLLEIMNEISLDSKVENTVENDDFMKPIRENRHIADYIFNPMIDKKCIAKANNAILP